MMVAKTGKKEQTKMYDSSAYEDAVRGAVLEDLTSRAATHLNAGREAASKALALAQDGDNDGSIKACKIALQEAKVSVRELEIALNEKR